jgi:hypothetical protein
MNEEAGNCNAELQLAALPPPNGDNTPASLAGSTKNRFFAGRKRHWFFSAGNGLNCRTIQN